MEDEENPSKPVTFELGQDISDMSVDELRETADLLRTEIARLEDAAASKSAHLSAAEALFKS